MPDALALALDTPGLGWLILAALVAGLVRGFTGFGTALILVPVATQFLPITEVILILVTFGFLGTAALIPRAWPAADKPEVAALAAAAAVTVPIGLWLLGQFDMITLRWIITGVVAITLTVVITGWRWHGHLNWAGRGAIGGAAGTLGGLTGLTGPIVIIFYLANARSAQTVRANTILFLAALDIVLLANLGFAGRVQAPTLWVSLLMSGPYLIGSLVGQWLFDPRLETAYRWAAYGVIGAAVIAGLPILD